MALKSCKGCGKQVDTSAKVCPNCGRPHPTTTGFARFLVGSFIATLIVGGAIKACSSVGDAVTEVAATAPRRGFTGIIERQVVDDAVKEYEIAKRSGSKIDACVHAGFVSAAFLQAKDEDGYQKAKAVEKADCRRAGVPQ